MTTLPLLKLTPSAGGDLIDRERTLLADLARLTRERSEAESAAESGLEDRNRAILRDYDQSHEQVESRYAEESAEAVRRRDESLRRTHDQCDADLARADADLASAAEEANTKADRLIESNKAAWNEVRWLAATVHESAVERVAAERAELSRVDGEAQQSLKQLRTGLAQTLALYRQPETLVQAGTEAEPSALAASFSEGCEAAANALRLFDASRILWWQRSVRWMWLPLAAALVCFPLAGLVFQWRAMLFVPIALSLTSAITAGVWVWLRSLARRRADAILKSALSLLAAADARRLADYNMGQARLDRELADAEARRNRETAAADEKYGQIELQAEQRRGRRIAEAENTHSQRLSEVEARRAAETGRAEEEYSTSRRHSDEIHDRDTGENEDRRKRLLDRSALQHENDWKRLRSNWRHGLSYLRSVHAGIHYEVNRWCPPLVENLTARPDVAPPVLRIGQLDIPLGEMPGGWPKEEDESPAGPPHWTLPALVSFPSNCTLAHRGRGAGREPAVSAVQLLMLRFLTVVPPGKVRFTILDPVGLGQNFSAFMHLADYEEALVANRIWTEPQHIEQRLCELTDQMELIIQRYLRNEYSSLEEYNRQAGPLAEPYRVLVVTDFPAGFTDEALERLDSILDSGPRCGVYVLATLGMDQPLPKGHRLEDFSSRSLLLNWSGKRFGSDDPDFGRFPLTIDSPPPPRECSRMLHAIGEQARTASRVELPFEAIAPSSDDWWTLDSRRGIRVPLGQSGATRLLNLDLGQGTSQHVLVAGKTGSGKSTLLHALITNLALHYSPDEMELYLVDFKKGVEFKAYAATALPHARVVAIESEREFGLSVLERLDGILRERGDLLRAAGVQDVAGYRQATGARLPRILLIVDEFQELFIEDDKLAQASSLLVDRLVRQGRAFGIHVLLGSQTLGGAYSLPRATIGQMAVRIALQCSEADAHLILSEENSAARLLSRPGEAIYNDANGLVAGNKPFQVAWLSDSDRDGYLRSIRERYDGERQPLADDSPPRPYPVAEAVPAQIVFEGNVPGSIERNPVLKELFAVSAAPPPAAALAWLGEPVAIKAHTAAALRVQGGHNLLLLGQQTDAALGSLECAMAGLAAQFSPDRAGFYLLDGTPADAPEAGRWQEVVSYIPHRVVPVARRDVPDVMASLVEELDKRQKDDSALHPRVFVVVFGLQRFRDLRREEPDFSFSSGRDKPPSASAHFAKLLQEGPALGMHSIVWCDTLNNLNRALDRTSIREFELRVLFQMSASDSSQLIDSADASRLGPHRALLHDEELGRLEKFRPYSLPTAAWLAGLKERLRLRYGMAEGGT
jgi:energy-coupling factor transporter ATP-binding protein EcfA2